MEATQQGGADARAPWLLQTHGSALVEQVLEYGFLAELTAELLRRGERFEVLRGDFDLDGHDLVIEARGVMRHIQLKAMAIGGRTAGVPINTRLAAKPSACVIWMSYDPASFAITGWRWFGGLAGKALPDLGERKARHTRANAQGVKAERPNVRALPASRFTRVGNIAELTDLLFDRDGLASIRRHLANCRFDGPQEGWLKVVHSGEFGAIPTNINWATSLDLAMLVDGYTLAGEFGLGDPFEFADAQLAFAQANGRWRGGAAELWTTLFLEHRRWRFSEPFQPDPEMTRLLDTLLNQLRAAVAKDGQRSAER